MASLNFLSYIFCSSIFFFGSSRFAPKLFHLPIIMRSTTTMLTLHLLHTLLQLSILPSPTLPVCVSFLFSLGQLLVFQFNSSSLILSRCLQSCSSKRHFFTNVGLLHTLYSNQLPSYPSLHSPAVSAHAFLSFHQLKFLL